MNNLLVFQSDFGLGDGAVSAMEGVAFGVEPKLNIRHLTHEITQFNVFEASYRLYQTINYWPQGTVFVSIVDPGVGSNRMSVVAKTKTGQYIVTPNNGTLTHINKFVGIEEVRQIDESINRLKGSGESYTFHGRDVYAYTGARLASSTISFEEVGPSVTIEKVEMLELYGSHVDKNSVKGQIDILDVRFGSLWTSVTIDDFKSLGLVFGDVVDVKIFNDNRCVYEADITYGHAFSDVKVGAPVVYMNSVNHMAVAINQGNFADAYRIGVGSAWLISFTKR